MMEKKPGEGNPNKVNAEAEDVTDGAAATESNTGRPQDAPNGESS